MKALEDFEPARRSSRTMTMGSVPTGSSWFESEEHLGHMLDSNVLESQMQPLDEIAAPDAGRGG